MDDAVGQLLQRRRDVEEVFDDFVDERRLNRVLEMNSRRRGGESDFGSCSKINQEHPQVDAIKIGLTKSLFHIHQSL